MNIISIQIPELTGWKNSGKTTLLHRRVAGVCGSGPSDFSIKHAQHKMDVDQLLNINDIAPIADFDLTQTGQKK